MTADNWPAVARAFIGAYGGFLLGLEDGECQGVAFGQSPRQWGAWRAYFKKRGIKTTFMDAKAKATADNKQSVNPHCWTVPAEWPHMFDADATVQEDHEAGNLFMRNWRPPNPAMADAAQRAITATKYKKWATETLRDKLPEVAPDEPKGKFIDVEKLLKDYEKDMAEARARSNKYQQAAE